MLKWTKELPSKMGWYWFRFDADDLPQEVIGPYLYWVYQTVDGEWRFDDTINHENYAAAAADGFWAGPIEAPDFNATLDRPKLEEIYASEYARFKCSRCEEIFRFPVNTTLKIIEQARDEHRCPVAFIGHTPSLGKRIESASKEC